MKEITIFYANKIYWEGTYKNYVAEKRFVLNQEIYNGAYCFDSSREIKDWFRLDGASVPLNNVPKKLRALVLIFS